MLAIQAFSQKESYIHDLDPRVRVLTCFGFALFFALSRNLVIVSAGLLLSIAILLAANITIREIGGRFLVVNIVITFLFLTIPFTSGNKVMFKLFSFDYSYEGFNYALLIAIRANALFIMISALLNTMDAVTFGHALSHLYFPRKLSHMFLFSVRYLSVIHQEYLRMKKTMKARAFKPGMNIHTYRTLGSFAAILLVRSLDRSERVIAAMKCRCFKGNFYMMHHFSAGKKDYAFAIVSTVILSLMIILECLWIQN